MRLSPSAASERRPGLASSASALSVATLKFETETAEFWLRLACKPVRVSSGDTQLQMGLQAAVAESQRLGIGRSRVTFEFSKFSRAMLRLRARN